MRGIIAVNARVFVNAGLTAGLAPAPDKSLWIQSRVPGTGQRGDDLCGHPRNLLVSDVTPEWVLVVDQHFFGGPTYSGDPVRPLAHELGHALLLGHGNGLDDNMDGLLPPQNGPRRFDEYCDPLWLQPPQNTDVAEDLTTPFVSCEESSSLMNRSASCPNLRPLQEEQAREVAKLVPGAIFDAAVDPAGWIVAPARACSPPCDLPADLYLHKLEMSETPARDLTSFTHTVFALTDSSSENVYLAYADLDDDESTGCEPGSIGLPGNFQGAELVTEVVRSANEASARVWQCQGGALVESFDPSIRAFAFAQETTAPGRSVGIITVHVPNSVRGPANDLVRLQAISRSESGASDFLPADGNGGFVSLTPPPLPECTLSHVAMNPGGLTTISASGLPPNAGVEALIGTELVGRGTTDGAGSIDLSVAMPATSPEGVRPILVVVSGTAINAVCAALVEGDAVTPATTVSLSPQPNTSDWNNTTVSVSLTAVDVPGGPGIRDITYSATGAQPIIETVAPGSSVELLIEEEGQTELSFFATNLDGVAERLRMTSVNIDRTPPTVQYTGNLGSYGILDTVQIGCEAADNLSGVASTTCKDIEGPAYLFDPSGNMFSATATDFADNVGQASTSFGIEVTPDDLCTLTKQFMDGSQTLATAFCAHLEPRGNETAQRRSIEAYIRHVAANPRGVFSAEEIEILIKLARALAE